MIVNSAEQVAPHGEGGPKNYQVLVPRFRLTYEGRSASGIEATYVVDQFVGDSYRKNFPEIFDIVVDLSREVFKIPHRQAFNEARQSMKSDSGSALLACVVAYKRPEENGILAAPGRMWSSVTERLSGISRSKPEGELCLGSYIGFSTEQLFMLNSTEQGNLRVLYMAMGAILPMYQRMGLGAKFLEIANVLHKPDILAVRFRSGAVSRSVRKSRVTKWPFFPLERRYNQCPVMKEVLDLLGRKTVHSESIHPDTGVLRRVYAERKDSAYKADRTHEKACEDDRIIREELLANPDEGDAVYGAAKVSGTSKGLVMENDTA